MASPKSKKSKRKQKQRPPGSQPLESKLKRLGRKAAFLTEPPDGIKMSEVLEAFVEPYLDLANTFDELRLLFLTAILAWNIALLPEDRQQAAIEDLVEKGVRAEDEEAEEARADLRSVLNELIARKELFFAEYNRFIVDFRLMDTGDRYYLTVLSSLAETP